MHIQSLIQRPVLVAIPTIDMHIIQSLSCAKFKAPASSCPSFSRATAGHSGLSASQQAA